VQLHAVTLLTDYSPNETSTGTGSSSGAYWTSVQKQTHFVTTIVVVCSWNCIAAQFAPPAITRSLKKWCLKSVLALFFFNFQVCPHVLLDMSYQYSKKVPTYTDENLCVILKTSIKSARTRQSSSDQSFSLANLSSYGKCFKWGIILVNLLRTFLISALSLI